ncbi:uncharacterized protein [Ptychodera flava]|uniref:uncharacterized protein n=1 Tax=Ptychodera flava TaxID=63121 RepID=UPI00396A6CBD
MGLQQHVHGSTHIKGHTLDLLITRSADQFLHSIRIDNSLISDHSLVHFSMKVQRPPNSKVTTSRRNYRKMDINDFQVKLAAKFSDYPFDSNPEILSNFFHATATDVLDDVVPVTTKVIINKVRAPWYTEELLLHRKNLRRLEMKWRNTQLEIDRQIFISVRSEYFRRCDDVKSSYHQRRIQEADSRKLFRIVGELSNANASNTNALPNNIPLTDLPSEFLIYFESKVAKLRNGLLVQQVDSHDILPPHVFTDFHPVTADQVQTVIKRSSTKSCDLDVLPSDIIKKSVNTLTPFLVDFFNCSLRTGIVPTHFKSAIIRPLLKKPDLDKNMLKSYRPVSNLTFFQKFLKELLHSNYIAILPG